MALHADVSRMFGVLCLLVAVMALSGCGTLRGSITTVLAPDLSMTRTVEMVGTGLFAGMLANAGSDNPRVPKHSSLKVSQNWEGNAYHLGVEVQGVPYKLWSRTLPQERAERNYYWFVTYYHYHAARQPTQDQQMPQQPPDEWAEAMAQSMVSFQESVTMPGRILHSNAGTIEGRTAVWRPGVRRLEQGYRLRVVSRRVNVLEVGATALLLIGLGAYSHYKNAGSSRRSRPSLSAAPPAAHDAAAPSRAADSEPAHEAMAEAAETKQDQDIKDEHLEYVRAMRRKGRRDAEIRRRLSAAGWAEDQIDRLLRAADADTPNHEQG